MKAFTIILLTLYIAHSIYATGYSGEQGSIWLMITTPAAFLIWIIAFIIYKIASNKKTQKSED